MTLFPQQCMICGQAIRAGEDYLNVYADEKLGAVHESCWNTWGIVRAPHDGRVGAGTNDAS